MKKLFIILPVLLMLMACKKEEPMKVKLDIATMDGDITEEDNEAPGDNNTALYSSIGLNAGYVTATYPGIFKLTVNYKRDALNKLIGNGYSFYKYKTTTEILNQGYSFLSDQDVITFYVSGILKTQRIGFPDEFDYEPFTHTIMIDVANNTVTSSL